MMSQEVHKPQRPEAGRINANDPREVRFWTDELGVDERTLKTAVEQVGPWAEVIRRHLRSNHGRG
jgi:hypothetical protein